MNLLDWLEAIALGIIQGLTEFLPISSDGHLALGQAFFDTIRGIRRSGSDKLLLDVLLHIGTLLAVLIYYRDWFRPLLPTYQQSADANATPNFATGPISAEYVPQSKPALFRLILLAIVATIPTGIIGVALKKLFEQAHDSLTIAAIGFWVTAVILLVSQRFTGGQKTMSTMTFKDAFLIGCAQALAPLPGVSRSGMTVAAALALGLDRSWAAIFSLWMSIPAISGALLLETKDALESSAPDQNLILMGLAGSVVSGLVGYGAILWLVRIVRSRRLNFFSWYLIALGAAVMVWAFLRK